MIKGFSRAIVWRILVSILLTGVFNCLAVADPPVAPTVTQTPETGTTATPEAPAAPVVEPPHEVESASTPVIPVAPTEGQIPETDTTATPENSAIPGAEPPSEVSPVADTPTTTVIGQTPEADTTATPEVPEASTADQPSEVAPAPAPDAPLAPAIGRTPETDTTTTPEVPAAPLPDQQPAAEPASIPVEHTPQDVKQDPEVQTVTTESSPIVGEEKSIIKAVSNNIESTVTLTTGMRKDDFQWSIAGDITGANPNVLSELTWSDVDSYEVSLSNHTLLGGKVYMRGNLNYAFIQSGRIQDSDYDADNRGDERSRSISNSSGDQIWDVSFAAGSPFFFVQKRLMVALLLGYAYHVQNWRITDGVQMITSPGGPALGPLSGLNSTYRSTWQGPWVGFDLRYRPSGKSLIGKQPMAFGLSFEYHDAHYEAEANWNLRSDFQHPVSFEHFADGQGITLAGEWLIGLTAHLDFAFKATYQNWKTDSGLDQAYNLNGTITQSRLNEVEWSNHTIMVGANYRF